MSQNRWNKRWPYRGLNEQEKAAMIQRIMKGIDNVHIAILKIIQLYPEQMDAHIL